MLYLFLLIQAVLAKCPEPISPEQLSQNLDSMSVAFSARDLELLEKYYTKNHAILPCLDAPITPSIAYRYHLFNGMYYWVTQENDKAKKSFSTSKQIDSKATINEFLFPEGHPIHKTYLGAEQAGIDPVLQEPKYQFYFDGRPMNVRPKDAPTIFQVRKNDKIIYSSYLTSDAPLPQAPFQIKSPKERTKAENTSFTPYVLLAISGTLMGASQFTARRFRTKNASNLLYYNNQVLFFSSLVTAGVAGTLFIQKAREKAQQDQP